MPLRPSPDPEDKLRGIRSVTDAALSHLGADDLLTTLLGRVRDILDADTAAVLLLDNSGRHRGQRPGGGSQPGRPDSGWPGVRGPHRR